MQKRLIFVILIFLLCSCTSYKVSSQEHLKEKEVREINKKEKEVREINKKEKEVREINKEDYIQPYTADNNYEVDSEISLTENTPPEVKNVRLVFKDLHSSDWPLYVEATGSDLNGDVVELSYEWRVNGEPAGENAYLESSIRRGDRVSIKITPFDGKDYGNPFMRERKIANLPPLITPVEEADFDGLTYLYQVKAKDPDGDSLTYSLKTAPEGMTIMSTSGLIVWHVPKDYSGTAMFLVVVEDGNGGKARHDMRFTVKAEETES